MRGRIRYGAPHGSARQQLNRLGQAFRGGNGRGLGRGFRRRALRRGRRRHRQPGRGEVPPGPRLDPGAVPGHRPSPHGPVARIPPDFRRRRLRPPPLPAQGEEREVQR